VTERISSGADPFIVTHEDIANAVRHIKLGKPDSDGVLSSDHLVNAPNELVVPIALLITGMFSHSFVANDLKTSCIIPIPNKQAKHEVL
jgi:hypothetical protein